MQCDSVHSVIVVCSGLADNLLQGSLPVCVSSLQSLTSMYKTMLLLLCLLGSLLLILFYSLVYQQHSEEFAERLHSTVTGRYEIVGGVVCVEIFWEVVVCVA